MYAQLKADPEQIFHHHWLKYFKSLSGISLLLVLGLGGLWLWPPLTAGLWGIALVWGVTLYQAWRWTAFWLTPDHRLVYRHGFQKCDEDTISLFGKLSCHQTPIVGRLFDVGTVRLMVPGSSIEIANVANFRFFYELLVQSAPPSAPPPALQYVPVVIVAVPVPMMPGAPGLAMTNQWPMVDQALPHDGRPIEFRS